MRESTGLTSFSAFIRTRTRFRESMVDRDVVKECNISFQGLRMVNYILDRFRPINLPSQVDLFQPTPFLSSNIVPFENIVSRQSPDPMVELGTEDPNPVSRLQHVTINGRRFNKDTMMAAVDDARMYEHLAQRSYRLALRFFRFATVLARDDDLRLTSDGLLLERCLSTQKRFFKRFGWLRFHHEETEEDFNDFCMAGDALSEEEIIGLTDDGRHLFRIV